MPAIAYRGQLNLCHCFKTLKKAAFRSEETTARERCLPGAPSTFEAEQAKGADVFIHEVMVTPEEFAEKNYVPVEHARLIMNEHTMPDELGAVFSIAKPRLGVGMHFSVGDSLIDPLFERWRTTYDGPITTDTGPDNNQCYAGAGCHSPNQSRFCSPGPRLPRARMKNLKL